MSRTDAELLEADESADAVVDVHDVVAHFEIAEIRHERSRRRSAALVGPALFLESIGYRSSLGGYLAEAGRILSIPKYVEAGGRVLKDVMNERVGDMWPVGVYLEFPVYRALEVGWR